MSWYLEQEDDTTWILKSTLFPKWAAAGHLNLWRLMFSHPGMSNSLPPHGLQHARPPCPFTNSQSLLKLTSTESVMPSNHLVLCHFLLLLPSVFPSIRVSSSESALHIRWPKYWSFSFSISSSNEYSGLISFRIDQFDLLAVQGLSRVFSNTTV